MEQEAFLELAHIAAMSDGIMSEEEEKLLHTYRSEMGFTSSDYTLKNVELAQCAAALCSKKSRNIVFIELLALIMADGEYHEDEKELLVELKQALGIQQDYYERCKAWISSINTVYQEGFSLLNEQS